MYLYLTKKEKREIETIAKKADRKPANVAYGLLQKALKLAMSDGGDTAAADAQASYPTPPLDPALHNAMQEIQKLEKSVKVISSYLCEKENQLRRSLAHSPGTMEVSQTFTYHHKRGMRALSVLNQYTFYKQKNNNNLTRADMLHITLATLSYGKGLYLDNPSIIKLWTSVEILAATSIVDNTKIWESSWRLRVIHAYIKPFIHYLSYSTIDHELKRRIARLIELNIWGNTPES